MLTLRSDDAIVQHQIDHIIFDADILSILNYMAVVGSKSNTASYSEVIIVFLMLKYSMT